MPIPGGQGVVVQFGRIAAENDFPLGLFQQVKQFPVLGVGHLVLIGVLDGSRLTKVGRVTVEERLLGVFGLNDFQGIAAEYQDILQSPVGEIQHFNSIPPGVDMVLSAASQPSTCHHWRQAAKKFISAVAIGLSPAAGPPCAPLRTSR